MVPPHTPIELQAPADDLRRMIVFFSLGVYGLGYAAFRSLRDRDPLPRLLLADAIRHGIQTRWLDVPAFAIAPLGPGPDEPSLR